MNNFLFHFLGDLLLFLLLFFICIFLFIEGIYLTLTKMCIYNEDTGHDQLIGNPKLNDFFIFLQFYFGNLFKYPPKQSIVTCFSWTKVRFHIILITMRWLLNLMLTGYIHFIHLLNCNIWVLLFFKVIFAV